MLFRVLVRISWGLMLGTPGTERNFHDSFSSMGRRRDVHRPILRFVLPTGRETGKGLRQRETARDPPPPSLAHAM